MGPSRLAELDNTLTTRKTWLHVPRSRMAVIYKSVGEHMEKLYFSSIADGHKNFADTLENSLIVSQMLNTNLPYDPAVPLLDTDSRRMKTCVCINACTHMFMAAPFGLVKKWNQLKCQLSDEWKKKSGMSVQWNTIWQYEKTAFTHPATWIKLETLC